MTLALLSNRLYILCYLDQRFPPVAFSLSHFPFVKQSFPSRVLRLFHSYPTHLPYHEQTSAASSQWTVSRKSLRQFRRIGCKDSSIFGVDCESHRSSLSFIICTCSSNYLHLSVISGFHSLGIYNFFSSILSFLQLSHNITLPRLPTHKTTRNTRLLLSTIVPPACIFSLFSLPSWVSPWPPSPHLSILTRPTSVSMPCVPMELSSALLLRTTVMTVVSSGVSMAA